jgi:putative FmdB family regulatory protein
VPIYTYRCQSCAEAVEKRQSFSDAPLTTCESCGGELRKEIHPAGIVFKGSGFYNTDYRGNGAAKPSESAKADGDGAKADAAGGSEAKADAGTADSSKTDASKSDGGTAAKSDSTPATPASTSGAKAS